MRPTLKMASERPVVLGLMPASAEGASEVHPLAELLLRAYLCADLAQLDLVLEREFFFAGQVPMHESIRCADTAIVQALLLIPAARQ